MGSEPTNHPKIKAFRHRFNLSCSNGFSFTEVCHLYILGPHTDFLQVLKSLPGSCESFLAKAYSSQISSFEALQEHLNIIKPTRNKMESIWQALSSPLLSLATVIIDFLCGRGAPCPWHLSMVSVHFPTIINLSHIGEDGFRAKHFFWAATGTYERELGAPPIKVQFVEEDDPVLRFTWTLFFSSHTYSTLTHTSHAYDSPLPHLLHSDSYLSHYDSSLPHLLHLDSSTPIVLLLYIRLDTHL